MDTTVPGDVDETDETVAVRRADPSQAALEDRLPVLVSNLVSGRRPQGIEFLVRHRPVAAQNDGQ